ncbi:ubiquitin-associated protein 2-like [Notothenia coriiceps]|uniref:ribonuclease H n=1 Tax=Notothenia coriiceps TaxID=8208 RepID=A0A6I9NG47_9TELE|nr:PREDICTED: ubiquitin-associated protein 2-like [Notothenia coriiceps]
MAREKLSSSGKDEASDRKPEQRSFSPGDQVLALLSMVNSPFQAKCSGPKVSDQNDTPAFPKVSDQNVLLSTPKRRKATQLCHINLLKSYYANESKPLSAAVAVGSQFSGGEDDGVTAPDESLLRGKLKNTETLRNLESLLGHMSAEGRSELTALIHSNLCLFRDTPSRTHMIVHDIDVEGAHPIRQRFCRVSEEKRQRLMNRVVSGLEGCAVYLDDVVIYSNTWEEHLARIEKPFDRLSEACLTVNLAKCDFAKSTVTYLGKAPPNLPPGVPPLLPNPYIMAPGLLHAYPPQVYGYDDLQMLQARIPLDYYSIAPFATPTAALTGRDGNLTNNPYSGDLSKFGRGDASSPSPATTLAQTQQNQTQAHHTAQQPFLNPALPPGYSYTSLPYYTGMPGLPNTFQYGPAVFPVAPTSSKQHGVNVGVNASAAPFQQASGYGSHGYSTGYEDVGQASGSGDFCKGGYGTAAAASAQNKPASSVSGPGVGVSVTSSNTGVPDISGSVYTKTQSFDKQGFHAGTPAASFSLPSALGSGGPINPPAATAYAPAPFMHILAPHQQPHSQILHHHLQQDGQSGTGQRSQNASLQQKSQINKSAYNTYNWGAN